MNLFVHICCGPCSISVFEHLLNEGHNITAFFFNPNIQPLKEYLQRKESAMRLCKEMGINLINADSLPFDEQNWAKDYNIDLKDEEFASIPPSVNPKLWLKALNSYSEKRCIFCWESRLKFTVRLSLEHNADAFTSTLLYSRYQNHLIIKNLAEKLSKEYNKSFYYYDFREFWQEGIDKSKEIGLYRQPYCGCIFSEYERYQKQLLKNI